MGPAAPAEGAAEPAVLTQGVHLLLVVQEGVHVHRRLGLLLHLQPIRTELLGKGRGQPDREELHFVWNTSNNTKVTRGAKDHGTLFALGGVPCGMFEKGAGRRLNFNGLHADWLTESLMGLC